MVLTETMTSTGHLPKFADDAYHLERDDLWLIPTAEVPLTSMHRGEILEESQLPQRFTAATACYRREAGSAGRDTRGLLRVHEFYKVELFAYTDTRGRARGASRHPGTGRVDVAGPRAHLPGSRPLCGDLGGSSARTFDLEAIRRRRPLARGHLGQLVPRLPGAPGQRALSPRPGAAPQLVHTVNGSALAGPRIWAALVETGARGRDRPAAGVPGAVSRRGTPDQGAVRAALPLPLSVALLLRADEGFWNSKQVR